MLTQKKVVEILRKNFLYLRNNYGVKKIGLFGSFAKGLQKENSDIDILVELKQPIGFKFMELAEYIENQLGTKVDILTSEGVKSIRLKKVAQDIRKSVLYV